MTLVLEDKLTLSGGGGGGGGAVSSVNGKTGAVVLNATDVGAEEVTNVVTVSSSTFSQQLANNTIYNCTTNMTSISVSFPSSPTADYISQLNFTSGSTATTFNASGTIDWYGDDVSTTFTPVANKRYTIMFYYDGVKFRGIVQA